MSLATAGWAVTPHDQRSIAPREFTERHEILNVLNSRLPSCGGTPHPSLLPQGGKELVVRIEAGAHKGTKLAVPDGTDVRPTSDRARQAIFNMLIHRFDAVEGASVLDAFAGSGALGLEALSRGASSLVAMELAKPALDALKRNISACRENARTLVFACNALSPPPAQPRYAPCSLVFLDPPYGQGLIAPALIALDKAGWIAPGALIVAEMGAREQVPEGKTLSVEDERRYGKARIVFLRNAKARDRGAI